MVFFGLDYVLVDCLCLFFEVLLVFFGCAVRCCLVDYCFVFVLITGFEVGCRNLLFGEFVI